MNSDLRNCIFPREKNYGTNQCGTLNIKECKFSKSHQASNCGTEVCRGTQVDDHYPRLCTLATPCKITKIRTI